MLFLITEGERQSGEGLQLLPDPPASIHVLQNTSEEKSTGASTCCDKNNSQNCINLNITARFLHALHNV